MSRMFEALTGADLEKKRSVERVFDSDPEFSSAGGNGVARQPW